MVRSYLCRRSAVGLVYSRVSLTPNGTIGRINTKRTMSGKSEDVKVDVSKEEVAAAKAEIDAEEAEFDDAESPHTGDFEVTMEEMSIIRAELACEFPDDYTYLR